MTEFVAWLLESSAITLLATAAIALVPASLPAVRHRLWWLTLCVVIGLPALDAWSDSLVWVAATSTAETIAAGSAAAAAAGASVVGDAASATGWVLPAPPYWLVYVAVACWALWLVVALTKLAREVAAAMHIAHASTPVCSAQIERWHAVARAREYGRRVRIVSADIRGACAIGIFTPSVVVGDALLEQMDETEAETIVLHEYAHLLRYDDWTQLAQRVILAFAGFHPAVRFISRRIDVEREVACDQIASRHSGSAITCARALARAAELSARQPALPMRVVPAASLDDGGLQGRVTRLLSDRTVKPWIASSVALVEAAVILAAGAAVFETQPVVDFQMTSADGLSAAVSESSHISQVRQASEAAPAAEPVERARSADGSNDRPSQPAFEPLVSALLEPGPLPLMRAGSEQVSADVPAEPNHKTQRDGFDSTGPILANLEAVAVRGAEHTEHTATLAQSVSSAPRSDAVSVEDVAGQPLTPKVSAPLEVTRLKSTSLDAVATSRWSQATERGADVGRSAAAAGQAIGRFFHRQGRAIARRF